METAPAPVMELEQRENRLIVYCPTQALLKAVTDFLMFKRLTKKYIQRRLQFVYQYEPCYKRTNMWSAVVCSAGFQHLLIERFRHECDFRISKRPIPRLEQNCAPDWSRLDPGVQFRANQREMLEAMLQADRGRIVVPTAVGKSFLIQQYVTLLPKARIIVSTYSNQVLMQLHEGLNKALLGRVGLWCSDSRRLTDARVVCVSQGLIHHYFRVNGDQDVDVAIIDEYHEWGSPKRLELLENIRYAKMFGLSANKSRQDKAEFRLNGLFGPVLAEMTYSEAVDKNLVTPIWVVWTPVRSNTDPTAYYKHPSAKEKHGVWRYALRNKIIAETVRLFRDEDQVLITVKTIDHALHLHKLLPEYTVVYAPKEYAQLIQFRSLGLTEGLPQMTKDRLNSLKRRFSKGTLKKVIATGVWSRGVNFPELSVLVRADASNSKIADTQWPGRAARKHEDKAVSLVLDFGDEYNANLHDKALARRKRYKEQGWKQISIDHLKQLMKMPSDHVHNTAK
jgi:superfamily II DNA or RNA helicase